MAIFFVIILTIGIAFALTIASRKIQRYIETLFFLKTPATIIVSEPTIVFEDELTGNQLYAPDIQFSYEVNGNRYKITRFPELRSNATPSEEEARELCNKFKVNSSTDVWFDPNFPWKAIATRELSLSSVAILFASIIALYEIYLRYSLPNNYFVVALLLWILFHLIANEASSFFQNAMSLTRIELKYRELREIPKDSKIEQNFFITNAEQLKSVGFEHLFYAEIPSTERYNHRNFEHAMISTDRAVLGIIGQVWYTGTLFGFGRFIKAGTTNLYLHSFFPNGTTIVTKFAGNLPELDTPHGITWQVVPDDASMEELLARHRTKIDSMLAVHRDSPISITDSRHAISLMEENQKRWRDFFEQEDIRRYKECF